MNRSRFTPRVEMLEDRTTPATLRLIGGNAFISNPATSTLSLTATGINTFNLTDGALSVNFTAGGTVFITGSNKADTINFDVAGNSFTGSLFVQGCNGNDTINIFSSVDGGELRGNVTAITGRGNDTLNLNNTAATAMTFRGRIQALNTVGNDVINLGNATGVTTFLGDVLSTGFSDVNVGFGAADVYGRDLIVRLLHQTQPLDVFMDANITFGRDVTIYGTPLADTVNILGPDTIGRNLNISLGVGNDFIIVSDVDVFAGGPLTVQGNFNLDMGQGDNSYDLDDPFQVFGDMNIWGGNGQNFVNNFNGSTGGDLRAFFGNGDNNINLATTGLTIAGDFHYTAGNGFNAIGFADVVIAGMVDIHLGNGNNVVTAIDPAVFGGTFNLQTGNGDNNLSFVYFSPILLDLNVQFGNGNDTVLVFGTTLTGTVDGGGGTNTFIDAGGNTYLPTFTLVNF